MPTYDYRCKDCGHEFEIHQSFSEDALTVCPNCQGNLRKVFSAVGISFKGSGFYKTDSRGGSSSTSSGGSTGSSSSPSTPAATSSDSGSSAPTPSSTTSSSDSSSSSSSTTASTTSP